MAKEKFEDALEKLEDIVRKMEAGDIPLDEALKSFEEGIKPNHAIHQTSALSRPNLSARGPKT